MTTPKSYTASQLLPSGHFMSRQPAGLEHLSDECLTCQLEAKIAAQARVLATLRSQLEVVQDAPLDANYKLGSLDALEALTSLLESEGLSWPPPAS